MLACEKVAASTLRGTEFPAPSTMADAEIGTSPSAEICTSAAPDCGTVGLLRSNLTTVSEVDGTVCPGATERINEPFLAFHFAVELNKASESSSASVASGVKLPISPDIVMVDCFAPVRANCGRIVTAMVFVAPGVVPLDEL